MCGSSNDGTILPSAGPLLGDSWYQHYERAEKALEEERWEEAVSQLQEALQRRGDSGARVRTYGMRTTDYFPYLKLGVAYFRLDQLDARLTSVSPFVAEDDTYS